VPFGIRYPLDACPYKGVSLSHACYSSQLSCFWSRALFLSRKRCLAAVIESSVFRFEILTASTEESKTKYVKAILVNENKNRQLKATNCRDRYKQTCLVLVKVM